jgi:hypothetical protein
VFFYYYQVGIGQFGVLDDIKHYLILKVDGTCSLNGCTLLYPHSSDGTCRVVR